MGIENGFRTVWHTAILSLALAAPAAGQAVPTPNVNQYGPQLMGAPIAWARGYTGAGIIVTVADSGIDPTHPAFAGKIDPRSRNYVLNAPGGPYDPANITDPDLQSHGTHVGGIVLSSAASGVPGIAYGANLIVLRALDNCSDTQDCSAPGIPSGTRAALAYFTGLNDSFIYNASYGPNAPANTTVWPASIISQGDADAALAALVKGKIIVAANGNDGTKSPVAGLNPNGLALMPFVNPANANAAVYLDGNNNYNFSNLLNQPGLIVAVASVGRTKLIAPYSQRCGVTASWCVSAPGGDQTNAEEDGIYSTLPGNKYGYQQGTSMAAPAVSGALAVLAQAYPGYAARDLANVMFATAENVGGRAGDNAIYGYGLVRLDRATDGPTTLGAGQAVDVAAQQMTYWSQPLTTAGGFSKTGAGYLMVAGRTTATGDVAVNAGALGVDGTLTLGAQLTVAQGATLAGFGRIVGNTVVNGTLNAGQLPNYADLAANNGGTIPAGIPLSGTSPGTLTFQGNVTLGASATMLENIDGALVIPGGPGTFDKIIVTGAGATFTAGGNLAPLLRGIVGGNNTYSPAVGTAFMIVSAQSGGAVAGQFATLAQPAAGLAANTRLDVVYAATTITINVTPLNFGALAAGQNLNPNAQALAGALDAVRPDAGAKPSARGHAVFDDLYDDSIAQDDAELIALSDQGQAALPGAVLSSFSAFSDLLSNRQAAMQRNAGEGPSPQLAMGYGNAIASDAELPGTSPDVWNAWIEGFGRWSRIGGNGGLPGAQADSSGVAGGVDRRFSPDLTAGAAFGYARTATAGGGTQADTDSYAAALYATWTRSAWILDARLAAGPTDSRTARSISLFGVPTLVTGALHGWSTLLALQAGYRLDLDGLSLRPYVGLTEQDMHQSAFSETTALGLSFPAQSFNRAVTALGARTSFDFDLAGLSIETDGDVAWTHDLHDGALVTHAAIFDAPFVIDAARPGRDAALVTLDLTAFESGGFSLFAGYTGEFRSHATAHEAHGGIHLAL